MDWFALTIIALSFDVLYKLVTRIFSVKSKDIRTYTVVFNFIASILVFIYLIFFVRERSFIINSKSLIILLLASLLYTLFCWFEFRAYRELEASVMSIFSKVTPVITFIASVVLLDESVTWEKLLSLLLILGPMIWLNYEKGKFKWHKGYVYAFMCSLSLGIVRILDKEISNYLSLLLYSFITYFIPSLFLAVFPKPITLSKLKKEVSVIGWKLILLHSFINVILFYTLIKALSLGEASKVTIVFSVSSIIAVLVAIVVLKEKEKLWVKIIAGILSFIGVILLKG